MTANYTYNALGLLASVVYGNGASTTYAYDAAHRVTQIEHRDSLGGSIQILDYSYDARGLPAMIIESGFTVPTSATTTFEYDHRGRLTREYRTLGPAYDLRYEYDAGGNRTKKIDALTYAPDVLQTEYTYDTSSPATYGSNNNRLESYVEKRISGQTETLLSTTWYYYHFGDDGKSTGNVERVVTKPEASATYESTFFAYAKNGQAVTHVVGEQWDDDGQTACFPLHTHGYVNTFGWEYRYDGARARYAARGLDPDRLYMVVNPLGGWSDYDGDEVYDDYYVNQYSPPTTTRRFEPGVGRTDSTGSAYYHADHLGTIRSLTNAGGVGIEPMAFTAFGERVVGTQDSYSRRYGYVGSFGYQASGEYPFLHVGARYYDPATGRFLQRDPIGIRGGLNVYAYSRSAPTLIVDPDGMRYQLPNIGPPPATGPSDEGMFDPIWTPVHYSAGYLADMLHIDFMDMLWWAIWYEEWEPNFWPGYRENLRNQYGDLISACIGWIDSHF